MKVGSFSVKGNIVDVVNKEVFKGEIFIENGLIVDIAKKNVDENVYILPGLIDSHIHVESSMLIPSEFAKVAVRSGTVAIVTDPHEIANVLGMEGVEYMIEDGNTVPFKFFFGAPSCVPATNFETSGYVFDSKSVEKLLQRDDILYLSEMMNFPGVVFNDQEVHAKIEMSKKLNKPIDGHAPGLSGDELRKYASAGITTDHECSTLEEAIEKIKVGIKIQIREGSAAKNLEALYSLIDEFPNDVMLCSDDRHPDDLLKGHVDYLVRKCNEKRLDIFNVLRAVTYNPVKHYGLNVGLLQKNDSADFIIIDNLDDFKVQQTYINGEIVFDNGNVLIKSVNNKILNNFNVDIIAKSDLEVEAKGEKIRVIEAIDGELFTKTLIVDAKIKNGLVVQDIENDILKISVVNRYKKSKIITGFIKNFGFKTGAIASSIAHDSHNIIAVGANDSDLLNAINKVIENRGGVAVSNNGKIYDLPLPIAGLMSNNPAEEVALAYEKINKITKEIGTKLKAPLMTLSFMALLVIPEFKIGDKGLFDGNKFEFVDLFVN